MAHPFVRPLAPSESALVLYDGRAQDREEIKAAYALVRDLMRPNPLYYWAELLLVGSAAWTSFLAAVALPLGSLEMWLALTAAMLLFYRISIFIHELTHLQPHEVPGYELAWNLSVGVVMLLPTVFYQGVHAEHHRKTTYGTANDPEYLPLGSRPLLVLTLVLASLLVPLHLVVRFFIDAPLSWVVPRFRRFIERRASAFCFNPFYSRTVTAAQRRRLYRWDAIVLAIWVPVLAATALEWLPWRWLPLWYAMYAGIATINHLRTLVSHRYRSAGEPLDFADQLRDTMDTPGAWWTVLWAPVGLRFHALHHLFPKIPYHNLAAAHRRLTRLLPEEAMYRQSTSSSFVAGLRGLLR